MTAQTKSREKALYLSLWGIIIFVGSVWMLWPTFKADRFHPSPEVELAKNVSPLFLGAQVTPTQSYDFKITLTLNDQYRSQMGEEPRHLDLGVRFISGESILEEKTVGCVLDPRRGISEVDVPNPQRFHPKRLMLYLAH